MFITRPIGDKLSTHKAGEGAKIDCDTMDSESFSEFLQNSLSAADFGHLFTNEEEEDEGRNETYYSQSMYDPSVGLPRIANSDTQLAYKD
jgi:hypothetical protein